MRRESVLWLYREIECHPDSGSATPSRCALAMCALARSDKKSAQCKKWECSTRCKPLTQFEVEAIVSFKDSFGQSIEEPYLSGIWVVPLDITPN